MSDEAEQFLRALWPAGLPDDGKLVVVTKQQRGFAPAFFRDIGEAAAYATRRGKAHDTYVGMAAQSAAVEAPSRGSTETAVAIPGLWLDVDFDKGFRDEATARSFLNALPHLPSVIVNSGGGVHAHWLFREPLDTRTPDEKVYAHDLLIGWLTYCREIAKLKFKADLDAVADLARVMRIPGTMNLKRSSTGIAAHLVN